MKLKVKKPVEVEVDAIRCVLPVRYEEEDMPNDYPHRKRDIWDVTIDIATGQIRNWPGGGKRALCMKVVDTGSYYLLAGDETVASIEQDYVPSCIPGEYGDYIDFKIDSSGRITNWDIDEDEVQECFFSEDDE